MFVLLAHIENKKRDLQRVVFRALDKNDKCLPEAFCEVAFSTPGSLAPKYFVNQRYLA